MNWYCTSVLWTNLIVLKYKWCVSRMVSSQGPLWPMAIRCYLLKRSLTWRNDLRDEMLTTAVWYITDGKTKTLVKGPDGDVKAPLSYLVRTHELQIEPQVMDPPPGTSWSMNYYFLQFDSHSLLFRPALPRIEQKALIV